ncbi:protein root UVB sensitive 1, chloroplastic, partial [Tanacetum coccineum]
YANVQENDKGVVFEVKGGRKTKLYVDELSDEFVVAEGELSFLLGFKVLKLASVWRSVQGVVAQVCSVLATQGAWGSTNVDEDPPPCKDEGRPQESYVIEISLLSLRENSIEWELDQPCSCFFGMEIVTPAFPHLFVPFGAAAVAGRSAAALIQVSSSI